VQKRKDNFVFLKRGLKSLEDVLVLPEPTPLGDPSWFGFPITLRTGLKRSRKDLQEYLDSVRIGTRLLFAGNLVHQPYFKDVNYRIAGNLTNTDVIMDRTFWLGVYPGLDEVHLSYVIEKMHTFFDRKI
jgi:CDP-6-deoxy-D-xylo-4-hexulose-3-dehydrase